jgi:hypothetical protein
MYMGFESKSVEWVRGMDNFLKEAFSEVVAKGSFRMPCPYTKCKNQKKKDYTHMYKDIFVNGYVPNYTHWVYHGERHRIREEVVRPQLKEFDADAGMQTRWQTYMKHEAFKEWSWTKMIQRRPHRRTTPCWRLQSSPFTRTLQCCNWMPFHA